MVWKATRVDRDDTIYRCSAHAQSCRLLMADRLAELRARLTSVNSITPTRWRASQKIGITTTTIFFFFSFVCLFISFSMGGVQWTVFSATSTKPVLSLTQSVDCFRTIWNRTRPRALVQNQHTMELISARKMSHKTNNKDLRMYLWWSSCTLYLLDLRMYLWWSSCTLYWLACHVRVTVGDSGLCCCVCVTSFERCLTPSCADCFWTKCSLYPLLLFIPTDGPWCFFFDSIAI